MYAIYNLLEMNLGEIEEHYHQIRRRNTIRQWKVNARFRSRYATRGEAKFSQDITKCVNADSPEERVVSEPLKLQASPIRKVNKILVMIIL